MTVVSINAANAQNDTVNPLFSTTGPNVLGQGHIQWNSSLEYYYLTVPMGTSYPNANLNSFGANTGLRFGIGDRAELTLDVKGAYNTFDTTYYHNTTGFTPSIGAKLLLYEGKGWLPKTAFFTNIALPVHQNAFNGNWNYTIQPEIGFQFRNTIGTRYVIDYSLSCSWNEVSSALSDPKSLLQYSVGMYRLLNDYHTLGIEVTNNNSAHRLGGYFVARWQKNDNLQLLAKFGFAGGISFDSGSSFAGDVSGLVGVSWMIR